MDEMQTVQQLESGSITDTFGQETRWVLYAEPGQVTAQIFTGSCTLHVRATPDEMTHLAGCLSAAALAAS